MIRLVTLTLTCPPLNGLYNVTTINCAEPDARIRGWRALIRGPAVFLVSPRGWKLSTPEQLFDPHGPRRVYEIPRADCVMSWATDDDLAVDKLQKFDSEPFQKPSPVMVADSKLSTPEAFDSGTAIRSAGPMPGLRVDDDDELERQTAPKKVK